MFRTLGLSDEDGLSVRGFTVMLVIGMGLAAVLGVLSGFFITHRLPGMSNYGGGNGGCPQVIIVR